MTITTPWTGDGLSLATAVRPKLLVDHPLPVGATCNCVGPGTVDGITVEVSGVDKAWLDAVTADATYEVTP